MKKIFFTLLACIFITANADAQWTNQSGTGNYYLVSGNVGIGTISPTTQLDVVGTGKFLTASENVNTLILNNIINNGAFVPTTQAIYLGIHGTSIGGTAANYSSRIVQQSEPTNHYGSNLIFQVHNVGSSSSYINALTLLEDGTGLFSSNVGIGTTSPTTQLDVVGTGKFLTATENVNTLVLNKRV